MGKDDFRAILNLRRDELSLQEERDLLDEAIIILLNFQTWDYRVTELQEVWSKIQNRAEMRRRQTTNKKNLPIALDNIREFIDLHEKEIDTSLLNNAICFLQKVTEK